MAKQKITIIKESMIETMQRKGINVTPYALDIINQYCLYLKMIQDLSKSISKDGVTIYDEKGKPKKNENINIMNNLNKQSMVMLSKLGLEPSEIKNLDGEEL